MVSSNPRSTNPSVRAIQNPDILASYLSYYLDILLSKIYIYSEFEYYQPEIIVNELIVKQK